MRTVDDIDEHRRRSVLLLGAYLSGDTSADETRAALQHRLEIAAGGWEIDGADGMAMYDVFMRLNSLVEPAAQFVRAHEMGHIVLGHAPFPSVLSCPDRRKREDDADAFAIALLTYDIPGETEAVGLALQRLGVPKKNGSADDRLAYGYNHAIQFGFGLAGLDNHLTKECTYREQADRIARLDEIRAKLVSLRADAFYNYFSYFRDHPPYINTSVDVETMKGGSRLKLARKMFASCHAGPPPSHLRFKKSNNISFGWIVVCPNVLPKRFAEAAFAGKIGVQTDRDIYADYSAHMPETALFDDETLAALLASTRH
jgi:hypothetical protein